MKNIIRREKKNKDISVYGIYRHKHPEAKIFSVIDNVAATLGIFYPSTDYSKKDIKIINQFIQANSYLIEELRELREL